jgi:hypothetical protein
MKSGAMAMAACAPIAPSLTCAQRKPGRVGWPPASDRQAWQGLQRFLPCAGLRGLRR